MAVVPAEAYSAQDAVLQIKGLIDEGDFTAAANKLEEYRSHVRENDGVVSTIDAVLCFHRKEYTRALEHALFAVELEQGHWAAFNCSARCYIAIGELDRAVGILKRLNGDHPEEELLDRKIQTQLPHFRAQASELLTEAVSLTKLRDLLRTRIARGKFSRLLKHASKLCAACPASTEMFILRLEVCIGLKQFDKALTDLAQLDDSVREEPRILRLTGQVMLYTGHDAEAQLLFENAAAGGDEVALTFATAMTRMNDAYDAAVAALKSQHHEEAHKLCTDALQIDRNATRFNARVYGLRARVHMAKREVASAIADCTMAIETHNTNAALYAQRATYFAGMAEWGLAVRDWRLATVKDPQDVHYQQELVRAQAEDALSKSTDHYVILGVSPQATLDEIRAAFHQLMLANHPDRCPPDQVGQANFRCRRYMTSWSILSDQNKRAVFDAERQRNAPQQQQQQPQRPADLPSTDVDDVMKQLLSDDTAPLS